MYGKVIALVVIFAAVASAFPQPQPNPMPQPDPKANPEPYGTYTSYGAYVPETNPNLYDFYYNGYNGYNNPALYGAYPYGANPYSYSPYNTYPYGYSNSFSYTGYPAQVSTRYSFGY